MDLSKSKVADSAMLANEQLALRYSEIEGRITVNEQSVRTTYRSPVNFSESMETPRHRWFPYKEGFSPSFVREFLQANNPSKNQRIFDPFSGSGTTCIVAGEMGLEAVGFDVSPLTIFVSTAKSILLDKREFASFHNAINEFASSEQIDEASRPDNSTIERYFEPEVYSELLRSKYFFDQLSDQKISSLFKLAFLNAIEPVSTHRKAGNGVKRKTNYRLASEANSGESMVKRFMLQKLREFAYDLGNSSMFSPPKFEKKSSLKANSLEELDGLSAVLTSPPYANCFDYSKIYMSELWLGDFFKSKDDQHSFRQESVRSHVHASWSERYVSFGSPIVDDIIRPYVQSQDLWSPRIGSMLSGYFADLGSMLYHLRDKMEHNAALGFVVGNSFYGGVPVATDLLLADLGQRLGYRVQEIKVYRGVIPSSQQYKLLGENRKYMRESLVVLRRD